MTPKYTPMAPHARPRAVPPRRLGVRGEGGRLLLSFEGYVAKDETSKYVGGRTRAWLGVKVPGGWSHAPRSRLPRPRLRVIVRAEHTVLTAGERRHKVGAYAAAIAAKRANRSTTGVGPELIQARSTP